MAVTPTYEEGYVRGTRETAAKAEATRVADVLNRDQGHVKTMIAAVVSVRRGLGNVASRFEADRAEAAARALLTALEALEESLATDEAEYRAKARQS